MSRDIFEESLKYHAANPPGKIKIMPSKPVKNRYDLSLAYTPGVGGVSKEIACDKEAVWKYTNRGNTVAIISDGTAVLGLGNIGPEAGLPVMEGKAVLFKKFADIDAYPLCLSFDHLTDSMPDGRQAHERMDSFVNAVRVLEPSFGGINLEDIKAPECFELQQKLSDLMDIAVFHDDQYGTAIVMTAGLINALKVVGKNFGDLKIVINGAGSAGIACARLLLNFGVKKEQIFMCDSKGLIVEGRPDINEQKREFAQSQSSALLDNVIEGADVFVGVSVAGALNPDMGKKMAKDSIVFALANPF